MRDFGISKTLILFWAVLALGLMPMQTADAQTARISMKIAKAGFVLGVSTGSGTLHFQGQAYPLSVGGLRVGLIVGASNARMRGEVYNLHKLRHIEGTYGSIQASAAAGTGGQNWVLENVHGVRLVLRGVQTGLEASLDAGGIKITLE
ncbi:MAG: hypothetical protein GY948_07290 [Alphaproteobacteria bacterium]|nr:hypothetical protein [Alphaproteobacteria bacterium]